MGENLAVCPVCLGKGEDLIENKRKLCPRCYGEGVIKTIIYDNERLGIESSISERYQPSHPISKEVIGLLSLEQLLRISTFRQRLRECARIVWQTGHEVGFDIKAIRKTLRIGRVIRGKRTSVSIQPELKCIGEVHFYPEKCGAIIPSLMDLKSLVYLAEKWKWQIPVFTIIAQARKRNIALLFIQITKRTHVNNLEATEDLLFKASDSSQAEVNKILETAEFHVEFQLF